MIRRVPQCFAEMTPYWVDEDGSPLFNDNMQLATDDDVHRSGYFTELDRLTLELCAQERGAGQRLPDWLQEAELAAFQRQRSRVARVS